VTRLSLATRLALGLVRVYRRVLSPWLQAPCRYVPTCSAYAEEALMTRGFLAGAVLAAWRLARCHPLGGRGLDPVPGAGRPSPSHAATRGH